MSEPSKTVCSILAGGKGLRLGGIDKATLNVGGQRMIDRVLEILRPQCTDVALCIQTQKSWANELGLQSLMDRPSPGHGPLGGIAAALHWANVHPAQPSWVVTTPVDIPFLPAALVENLVETDSDIVMARSGGRDHFAVAAWRPSLITALDDVLTDGPMSVRAFQAMHSVSYKSWPIDSVDPFLNINTPADVKNAERYMKELSKE